MEKKVFKLDDYEVTLGKFAQQADGSAWIRKGGTIVLSTAVASPIKEFPGFFPLSVDYREIFAAAGKIPGGYFKREGKFTDKEVLTARLIDRTIRPLFPANYFNQVQALSTVYSVDKENMPANLALLGTSIALATSNIPFLESVGVAEIGRVNDQWIINPTYSQSLESDVKIVIGGTIDGVCMVEGSTKGITEDDLVDIIFMAHEEIKKQVLWQQEIIKTLNVEKKPVEGIKNWDEWKERAKNFLTEEKVKEFFNSDKIFRNKILEKNQTEFLDKYREDINEEFPESFLKYIFEFIWKDHIVDLCFKLNKRLDMRDFDTVRKISCEVGLLPYNHGSSLFTRGRTQALTSLTLGGGDEFRFDELMGEDESKEGNFLLHYNFPPFSVGETRPLRSPSRREIGHGHLAASAISQVLPDKEKFPYLIRIVADILESNGSSSMATVCGSTMALLDGGVPIRKMVSGVAMGFIAKDNEYKILTDISGNEDAFGLMDFKVAGTADKILAIQMDIKHKGGLKREILKNALAKALKGRLHILEEMQKVMDAPRKNLSEFVPRFKVVKIPREKIGAIIGSGGKTIKEIIEKTDTTIDIEDDGTVNIFGQPGEKFDKAIDWIKLLAGMLDKNKDYPGKIVRVADFGFIVELIPGVDGMVHISTIPKNIQDKVMRSKKVGDPVTVKIMDYNEETGRIKLKLV